MLRTSRLWLTVILAVLVSIALSFSVDSFAGATAALTATPSTAGKAPVGLIVFDSDRSGNREIFVTRPDGSGLSQLTNSPASDQAPSWSPDGKHIVFSSDRDGRRELYMMNANGSGVKRLTTTGKADENAPAWSPDGKKIVYFVSVYDPLAANSAPTDIAIMNADGSKQEIILDSAAQTLTLKGARTRSPDSRKIASGAQKNGKRNIFGMKCDGSNLSQLTTVDGANVGPAWSPDGKKIAYISSREADAKVNVEIFVANSDGSNEQALTPPDEIAVAPAWSPDGKQLVFVVLDSLQKVTVAKIYMMDAYGSNPTPPTTCQYLAR